MTLPSLMGVCATVAVTLLRAGEPSENPEPLLISIGSLTFKPTAFIEDVGVARSSTTPDSIATKFGNVPLNDSPGEFIHSARGSRLMLRGDLPAGALHFKVYLESDFLNFTPGQSAHHWRQYWGQASYGKWKILGGQAWSLLRSNRSGIASDVGIMATDVIDLGFHVGINGGRARQIRVTRELGKNQLAVAWEGNGNYLTKFVRDHNRSHYELGGFTGRNGQRGLAGSAIWSFNPRFRLVTIEYWNKRAACLSMGIAPVNANGFSTLEGLEVQVRRTVEIYSYAGLVYASRAVETGNRAVRQYTAGVNKVMQIPAMRGGVILSLQYSHIDRAVWNGKEGVLDFMMYRLRYTFN